jgi:hypothetical protein
MQVIVSRTYHLDARASFEERVAARLTIWASIKAMATNTSVGDREFFFSFIMLNAVPKRSVMR